MIILGIDPGFDGAIALLDEERDRLPFVWDTPTLTISSNQTTRRYRRMYDIAGMRAILRLALRKGGGPPFVGLERVHAMPGQGVVSMFSMGFGLGVWEGLLVGLQYAYEYVTPQAWQSAMMDGQGKGKDAARQVAMRLFPDLTDQLKRHKDHGRADALLIAEFCRRRYEPSGQKSNLAGENTE